MVLLHATYTSIKLSKTKVHHIQRHWSESEKRERMKPIPLIKVSV